MRQALGLLIREAEAVFDVLKARASSTGAP